MSAMSRCRLFLAFALIMFAAPSLHARDAAGLFIKGLDAYEAENYILSADLFLQVADQGIKNADLYYNLGNAYLKQDDLGLAILWYERAKELEPGDPDLAFNHEYALSLTKDEKPAASPSLLRILFFWKYRYSRQAIRIAALFSNILMWTVLFCYLLSKKKFLKRLALPLTLLTILLSATAAYNYMEVARVRIGIILPEEVSVRSGFSETSTELFILHAGSRVTVEKEDETHYRIKYSEGRIGWVRLDEIGLI